MYDIEWLQHLADWFWMLAHDWSEEACCISKITTPIKVFVGRKFYLRRSGRATINHQGMRFQFLFGRVVLLLTVNYKLAPSASITVLRSLHISNKCSGMHIACPSQRRLALWRCNKCRLFNKNEYLPKYKVKRIAIE